MMPVVDEVPQLDFSSTGTDSDSGATSDRQSVPISSLNETESRMNVSTGFTNDRRSGRKRKPTNPDKVQSALKKRCETNSDVADSSTATSPSSTVSDDQVSDSSRTSSSASSSLDILSRVSTTRRPNRAIATTVYRTCQSCKRKTSFAHLVPINTHHHINPFMNTSRRYAVTLPDYLDPNTKNSLAQRLTLGSSSMATPNATKSAINNKPYTSFIPVESVLMCETCAIAFRKHRRQCDTCLFVPAMEERHNRDCTRCFEGVISLS